MSKEEKKKKKTMARIKLFCFWLIMIVLIVVLLKVKANRTNGGSIIGMLTNNGKTNTTSAESYVKEHYLKYKLLDDLISGATKENKLKYVIDIINDENGSRLEEIETSVVAAKYKEVFTEDLVLGAETIYTPNLYRHDEDKNFESLLIEEETAEVAENVEGEETKQVEDYGDTMHKLVITGTAAGKNNGETVVSIKCCDMKGAEEILEYAKENPNGFDVEKIKEISEKENKEASDYKYLYDLVTEANINKLTFTQYTAKMTVKDNGNGTYSIVSYTIDQ